MLNAKSIATSGEGSSGRYVASLIERLGIAEQVKPKIKSGGSGTSAQLVSRGEVDFVVSGLPPLIGTPDIEWLGYLPPEINNWLLFSGGLGVHAKEADAGRASAEIPHDAGCGRGVEGERPGARSVASGRSLAECMRPFRAQSGNAPASV